MPGGSECTSHLDKPEKEDPHGESMRHPLIMAFAVSRDLRKHRQRKTSPDILVLRNALEDLPLRVEGRGGTHHIPDD